MGIKFTKTVHPVDFTTLYGREFERLVFATLVRMRPWLSLNWYGQSGAEGGRDIVGTCEDSWGTERSVVVACANWKSFTTSKGTSDLDKLVASFGTPPDEVIVVAGKAIGAKSRETCIQHGNGLGIREVVLWSGSEFEEILRFHAPAVLERFVGGEQLPDEPGELKSYLEKLDPIDERAGAEQLARLFDRPAFQTRIWQESNLPDFRKAISDTIGALNTGIWRDREGSLISRVPSRFSFSSDSVQANFSNCVKELNILRVLFDEGIRNGEIRHCGCGKPDCQTLMIETHCAHELEKARYKALRSAEQAFFELKGRP